jgi:DNA-binding NtrC family response regulator
VRYHALVGRSTDTALSGGARARGAEWALIVAMDCQRPELAPLRVPLGGVEEVELGRGDARRVERAGARMRVELPSRWMSGRHARLVCGGAGWTVEDAGSKNGTRVNGAVSARAAAGEGDCLECGGTFLMLRRADPRASARIPPLPGLATVSPLLERELVGLPRIARSPVAVLVRGESGTGKELVAAALHELSGRAGALVTVNCGAIPATLVESELFGTRRGAFSGAEERAGVVRGAAGGTLFLDEIAELPASSQAALLRFLQAGELRPLGAERSQNIDVRVVAATNRPLEALVAGGAFRGDLFARLRGYEIHLPPLRARLEDLGLLVAALLARHDPQRRVRALSRAAARALFAHPWRYNVRELEQVLRAALALCPGAELQLEHLALPAPGAAERSGEADGERLRGLLAAHGGNLSAVARELATSRSHVRRLLARHGVERDPYRKP